MKTRLEKKFGGCGHYTSDEELLVLKLSCGKGVDFLKKYDIVHSREVEGGRVVQPQHPHDKLSRKPSTTYKCNRRTHFFK